jgi:DNA-binding MarR family transcriptional regulator
MTKQRQQARRYDIRRLAKEIHNAAACLAAGRAEICKKTGLSAEHWRVLSAIDRSSYTLSISDLARQLRLRRQTVHPMAVGLERVGWIRFLPNRDDRRLLQMKLTEHGKCVLSVAESRLDMWLLTMNSDLGDREVRELVNTVRAVRERIARARDYV